MTNSNRIFFLSRKFVLNLEQEKSGKSQSRQEQGSVFGKLTFDLHTFPTRRNIHLPSKFG